MQAGAMEAVTPLGTTYEKLDLLSNFYYESKKSF